MNTNPDFGKTQVIVITHKLCCISKVNILIGHWSSRVYNKIADFLIYNSIYIDVVAFVDQ